MRKTLTIIASLLFTISTVFGQASFSDDFESYTLGAYIGTASPNWTTWTGATGGAEDAQATNTNAASGTQSIHFLAATASGGPQDVVLPFGGEYNTGTFTFEMAMMIEANKGAYFNFQENSTPGVSWALESYFTDQGNFRLSNTDGIFLTGTYPNNTWMTIRYDINLNTNHWEFFINNVSQGSFSNSRNQVASINIFPYNAAAVGGNGQSAYYVDDVNYNYTAYVLPTLNGAPIAVGIENPASGAIIPASGIVGQQRKLSANVRNIGVNTITSFDISCNYNGNNQSQSVSGVNIASLASMTYEFPAPYTFALGNNPCVVIVSNVNGAGPDGDVSDDTLSTSINITSVPNPDKIVIVEEGTGTWCQWCPRGAVYMDYLSENYAGFVAPIAVHNNDPMLVDEYDSQFSVLLTGYPSVLVDRGTAIDPLDAEAGFLQQITQAPAAIITNGAQWDAGTRALDVSLTYDFSAAADSGWHVVCVITEDSVSDVDPGYDQANAYAGGSNGLMGGFESLPGTVPAASMNYNHVARGILPGFYGGSGFPVTISNGFTQTFNFTFVLDGSWDENRIHIVGMLLKPDQTIDNGSFTSRDEAISNGFVLAKENPMAASLGATVYPNPSAGLAWLSFQLNTEEKVTVTLQDISGNVISSQSFGSRFGMQMLPLPVQDLAKGIYLVNLQAGERTQVLRLAVQ